MKREMTERISLQRPERTYGSGGVPATQWTTVDTVWAAVNALAGFEYYAARSAQAGVDYEVVVRHPLPSGHAPSSNWRLVWRDQEMNVTAAPVYYKEPGGGEYYVIRAASGEADA